MNIRLFRLVQDKYLKSIHVRGGQNEVVTVAVSVTVDVYEDVTVDVTESISVAELVIVAVKESVSVKSSVVVAVKVFVTVFVIESVISL